MMLGLFLTNCAKAYCQRIKVHYNTVNTVWEFNQMIFIVDQHSKHALVINNVIPTRAYN